MCASFKHWKKMGAELGRRFLKQPAAKLEPVIVGIQKKKKLSPSAFFIVYWFRTLICF